MTSLGKIHRIVPPYAIPGAELVIDCENVRVDSSLAVYVDGEACRNIAASSKRVVVALSDSDGNGKSAIHIESGEGGTKASLVTIGRRLAEDMHIVANPAIDPKDDSLILTRSGPRGQQLASTLFRLETDGYLDEMTVEVLNPTGVAFNSEGELFVTNRAEGRVCRIDRGEESIVHATRLGVATGIAFDSKGVMYVGDRTGVIHIIRTAGLSEQFATLEPSVAAYHLAFGPDDKLYVTAPGLASHDSVHVIDTDGKVDTYFRGLGRPQGLAFDTAGNLYVAACYQGRHGVVRIAEGGGSAELFASGNSVVGLCFTRNGEMIVATGDAAYSLNVGIYGTLLK